MHRSLINGSIFSISWVFFVLDMISLALLLMSKQGNQFKIRFDLFKNDFSVTGMSKSG